MTAAAKKSTYFKLALVWLAIILFSCFWFSVGNASSPIILTVIPEVPREGEPVYATFKLNNPSSDPLNTSYQFFANGVLISEGQANLAPGASQTYEQVFAKAPGIGKQMNFMVTSQSREGNYERLVSVPPFPPQVSTSFISFASFSTSVMTSMSSMAFYQGSFTSLGINIGILLSVALIVLLVFLELSDVKSQNRILALGQLRIRFQTLTWVLLIVFLALVYTRVILILTG